MRGGPSTEDGVLGEEACDDAGETFLGEGEGMFDRAGGLLLLLCGVEGVDVCRTTSSFHFFTIVLALIESFVSLWVLSFPIVLPISVFF